MTTKKRHYVKKKKVTGRKLNLLSENTQGANVAILLLGDKSYPSFIFFLFPVHIFAKEKKMQMENEACVYPERAAVKRPGEDGRW